MDPKHYYSQQLKNDKPKYFSHRQKRPYGEHRLKERKHLTTDALQGERDQTVSEVSIVFPIDIRVKKENGQRF